MLAMLACVVLAGCTIESVTPEEPESFDEQIAAVIEQAEAEGAGDAQLAILRQAQVEGVLSIEGARAAARAAVECVNDAGSYAFYDEFTMESGLVVPGYNSAATTSEELAIADACDYQEDRWVNMFYQTQPGSTAANEVYLEQQVPLVRSCLERNGYSVAPDATTSELLSQASQVREDTEWAVDCLAEAEIGSF
jgi:hypothetical protein